MAEEEVANLIATQPSNFVLGPNELSKLKQAGVPDTVIAAMQKKN